MLEVELENIMLIVGSPSAILLDDDVFRPKCEACFWGLAVVCMTGRARPGSAVTFCDCTLESELSRSKTNAEASNSIVVRYTNRSQHVTTYCQCS